jgi:glycine/D-amino acid oxidase-like deaminating enzyme
MNELQTDVLIVGGGVGGCAAALAAAKALEYYSHRRIRLDRRQLTSQGDAARRTRLDRKFWLHARVSPDAKRGQRIL